jgi:hypothetical protein
MRRVILLVASASAAAACSGKPGLPAGEKSLRDELGIPADAKQVIIFGQNAHLDIDWQKTFDDYYTTFVENVYLAARQLVDAQPRAFYATAEMAFLSHHLAMHPEELAPVKADIARGAWRIVGGGITSPDTLLPETELLARDYLYGIKFSEDTLAATPTAAWLPDSFGHGGAAPDILTAAGFTSVALSRLDGGPTIFDQLTHPNRIVPADSTAGALLAAHSDDFLWKGVGGATILAHYMSGTGLYCQGENIDYEESLEPAGMHTGPFKGDDPTYTDGQIDFYIGERAPVAKTPYLFVPVGCDFQMPKEMLIAYLDGYNQRRYPTTHVWAVAAPFDDYAKLVSYHAADLPTVDGELTPYFMGFYGSRADVKRGVRDAARPFFTAEPYAALLGTTIDADALTLLTRADHHDFVTGTAADDVVSNEQLPLLATAQAAGQAELAATAQALAARAPVSAGATNRVVALNASSREAIGTATVQAPAGLTASGVPMEPIAGGYRMQLDLPPFGWQVIDLSPGTPPTPAAAVSLTSTADQVILSNARVRAQLDRQPSGEFALTSLTVDGNEAISAPSMTVNDYRDDGGLWRLGNEMGTACHFTEKAPAAGADTVNVLEETPLVARVAFVDADETREVSLEAGEGSFDVAITTAAAPMTTRTVAFALNGGPLTTSVPGGAAQRAAQHVFTPTFWPAVAWARSGGWAILLRQSTGVRSDTPGALELMAVRDAMMEQCDLEGGTGVDAGTHRIEWRIEPVASDAEAERAAQSFDRPIDLELTDTSQSSTTDLAASGSIAGIDGDGSIVTIKPAERGAGVIVRALLFGDAQLHTTNLGTTVTRTDLVERDQSDLTDAVNLKRSSLGGIVTLRVH